MTTLETILQILGIVFFVVVYLILPALFVMGILTVGGGVTGFIGGILLTPLFPKLPIVAQFFNHLTETAVESQTDSDIEERRSKVVGGFLLVYGVIFAIFYLLTIELLYNLGYALLGSLPALYSPAVELLYPIYTLVVTVPLIFVGQYLIEGGEGLSLSKGIVEWSVFLFIVNVFIMLSLLSFFFFAELFISILFS